VDLDRGTKVALRASSITSPSVVRLSLEAFLAKSSRESEIEIVVLTHQVITQKHHDVTFRSALQGKREKGGK
jgi:hypothetical protein